MREKEAIVTTKRKYFLADKKSELYNIFPFIILIKPVYMKTIIKTGFAFIFLLAISCTKESIHKSSSTDVQSTAQMLGFSIGQHYGGGVIFYIDSTGQHGLIADTVDLRASVWWDGADTITGAKRVGIGFGKANTKKIILIQGNTGNYAARKCWHYNGNGYTDWFLPSKDELNELYKHRNEVGGFAPEFYWSSTESGTYGAWFQNFGNGGRDVNFKYHINNVRAVRAF